MLRQSLTASNLAALTVLALMIREELLDEEAHAAWRAEAVAPEAMGLAQRMEAMAVERRLLVRYYNQRVAQGE